MMFKTKPSSPQRIQPMLMWLSAAAVSLVINGVLFSLIPSLMGGIPGRPDAAETLRAVNFIRIKPPEPPPIEPRPRKQPDPRKPVDTAKAVPMMQKMPPQQVLRPAELSFELNPNLPDGIATLPPPQMQMPAITAPALKDVYDIQELDQPLTPLVKIPPMYPLQAKRLGIEGRVKVKFLVTDKGTVEQVQILESQPEAVFDASVIQCVSAWRYSPGTVQGTPVKVWVVTPIRFALQQ